MTKVNLAAGAETMTRIPSLGWAVLFDWVVSW